MKEDNKLIIYKNSDGNIIVDAIYKYETLWLSQKGRSKVFNVGIPAISKHLKNIFEENEIDRNSVVSKMEITADDGKNYNTEVYLIKKQLKKLKKNMKNLELYKIKNIFLQWMNFIINI